MPTVDKSRFSVATTDEEGSGSSPERPGMGRGATTDDGFTEDDGGFDMKPRPGGSAVQAAKPRPGGSAVQAAKANRVLQQSNDDFVLNSMGASPEKNRMAQDAQNRLPNPLTFDVRAHPSWVEERKPYVLNARNLIEEIQLFNVHGEKGDKKMFDAEIGCFAMRFTRAFGLVVAVSTMDRKLCVYQVLKLKNDVGPTVA